MASLEQPAQGQRKPASSSKLEDQAATAALYYSPSWDAKQPTGKKSLLDNQNRLSSAGAAASLRYAKPTDLPSYPVLGLSNKGSSAGMAATLANANQKPFELWKPDPSASASAAAVLAKDYKMADLWHPEQSAHGAKAAILAANEGGSVKIWRPSSTEYGHSAAVHALRARDDLVPQLDRGYTPDGRERSLKASSMAMASSRRRADSTPAEMVDHAESVEAAHSAHLSTTQPWSIDQLDDDLTPAEKASRIRNIHMSVPREMFGSRPPVGPEVEEKKKQDALHSAAVSMAKQMYNLQQKTIVTAASSGNRSSHVAAVTAQGRNEPAPMRLNNLEEAARKLAAERLAKLHDEHATYREYYGFNRSAARSSLRGPARRRASSLEQTAEEAQADSRRIRPETSIFSKKVTEGEMMKRQKDREALLAAAQRNVRASMHGLDEEVFSKTGRVPPSLMQEWEAKARAVAEADSKARMTNYGKVNIGGGKFIDQADVDAVAARNVQPVLDEINEKAELHHAQIETARLDREQMKREAEEQRARDREVRAELRMIKDHDRTEDRARKEEEKVRRWDEKLRAKEEKRKLNEAYKASQTDTKAERNVETSEEAAIADHPTTAIASREEEEPSAVERAEASVEAPVVVETTTVVATVATVTTTEAVIPTTSDTTGVITEVRDIPPAVTTDRVGPPSQTEASVAAKAGAEQSTGLPTSSKHDSRVKSWLKDRFSRSTSKSYRPEVAPTTQVATKGKEPVADDIVGGLEDRADRAGPPVSPTPISDQMTGARTEVDGPAKDLPVAAANVPLPSTPAVVHETHDNDLRQSRSRRRSPSPTVSPVTDDDGVGAGAREMTTATTATATKKKELDPAADERRDRLDEGLAAPRIAVAAQRTSDSPVRDSKFQEVL
ncbi:MAG: hypothetical protein M1826_003715 [Phylliscum demangeonii]|nr:MAG: hypothetical protein M1826_003715 [Phylliscum demangeonii]